MRNSWKSPVLNRRSFLQGTGATLSLPFLEAMMPRSAFAAEATTQPLRMAFVFFPNGAIMDQWTPAEEGNLTKLSPTLSALEPVKQKILVLSGLAQDNARAKGDGGGDHARSAAAFLTGAHPAKTNGADIRNGVSVDQIAAAKLGSSTLLPSLELGIEAGRNAGECDSGYSCAYSNAISWKTATTPMAKETIPRLVFERMFGGSQEDLKSRAKRDHFRKSILDMVLSETKQLQQKLGKTDQRKLDEYFTSVRDIEERIDRAQKRQNPDNIPGIVLPEKSPKDLNEHLTLMFDLLTIAFQTDTTRIASFMLANEGSNRSYPMVGVNDGHHHLSHHQKKQDWIRQLQLIDAYLVKHFANFLAKLDSIQEGDRSLLDRSMIVYGSAIGDGNAHHHHNLPIVLAGGGNGTIRGGRHIRYEKDTPLNNLYLNMLDRIGAPVDSFGDSKGRLVGLDT